MSLGIDTILTKPEERIAWQVPRDFAAKQDQLANVRVRNDVLGQMLDAEVFSRYGARNGDG